MQRPVNGGKRPMNRVWTGIRANVSTFLRTPLNVVLALLLPIVVIEGWGQAMAGLPSMPLIESQAVFRQAIHPEHCLRLD